MSPMTQLLYTCDKCGITDREVLVPARTTEDIVSWIKSVCAVAIGADHAQRSPTCRATHISKIKIHIPASADRLGGAPVQ